MPLDLSGLKRAMASLDEALTHTHDAPDSIRANIIRDSIIHRFEYTYELSWKLLQRWVKLNVNPEEAEPRTKKDFLRLAAKKQLIDDPEAWFEFTEARNAVAHTYNEKNAEYVHTVALKFLPAVKTFYTKLKQHND